MQDESLTCVDFESAAVRTNPHYSGQSLRFSWIGRLPLGSIRIHVDIAHVIGIGVDDVADTLPVLSHRSISETLLPQYKPPHAHKLLGDVVHSPHL